PDIRSRCNTRRRDLINVCFGPPCGLKSDISRGPRSAHKQTCPNVYPLQSVMCGRKRVLNGFTVVACELFRPKLEGQLIDLAIEPERNLIVGIDHGRPRV